MRREATTGHDLLRYLREEGFRVRSDGEKLLLSPASELGADLRSRVEGAKPDLLSALRREQVEHLLDLVPVDPETGLPDLPVDEPATARQVERLRELADHPAFGEHRPDVRRIVEKALGNGLSQLGAYALICDLGRRIADREGGTG